ncbi:MAG: pyridoxamine 5'-phosphate oxidase family protein [Hyphomicrobiaceae bacterium]
MIPDDLSCVTDEASLRALHLAPMSRATDKVLTRLDKHCRDIVALSPFCVIATQGADGADVSPRGDPAGFVRVLDDTHLLVPDRIGNNRLDSMVNLLTNPAIGILFLIPGMDEALRVNGTARLTDDKRVLEQCAMQGRVPVIGLLVTVNEAFLHCPKALVRSALWNPARRIDRNVLPTYGQMLTDHCEGLTAEESERQGRIMAERGLY